MYTTQSHIIIVIAGNIETTKTVGRSPAAKQILVLWVYITSVG